MGLIHAWFKHVMPDSKLQANRVQNVHMSQKSYSEPFVERKYLGVMFDWNMLVYRRVVIRTMLLWKHKQHKEYWKGKIMFGFNKNKKNTTPANRHYDYIRCDEPGCNLEAVYSLFHGSTNIGAYCEQHANRKESFFGNINMTSLY